MAFRDFTYPSVLGKLDLTVEHTSLASKSAPCAVRKEFAECFEEGLAIAAGPLGVCTEKAKSEFLIAPMLVELRRTMARRFSIFSGMELNVNKGRGLNGSCDYILTKGGNQHLREAPIIGIVEAKNEEFSQQGLGQCIAAMFAARHRNQKDGWPIARVFGAVTTGRTWQVLQLEGRSVLLDRERYQLHQLGLGQVLGLLKRLIERALSPAQRPLADTVTELPEAVVNIPPS